MGDSGPPCQIMDLPLICFSFLDTSNPFCWLFQGGDLFEAIVKATKYTELDASHMIRDLASALDYLHCNNIVHRDIKPENLLVSYLDVKVTY